MYHPACWIVFTATTALLFIPGRAKRFFSRGWGGECGKPSGAGDPDFMHIAHERTQAGRQQVALQQGIAKCFQRNGVQTAIPVPRGRAGPPGRAANHMHLNSSGICGGASRSLSPPATFGVNDGVTELFHLQSWAPPVPSCALLCCHAVPVLPLTPDSTQRKLSAHPSLPFAK